MTDRPDLRHITSDIRAALADADRDTLVDVLTYVFEEYVIESPPPMRVPPPAGLDDLAELDFPALVERLQTHLDHPELDRFRLGVGLQTRSGAPHDIAEIGGDLV